MRSIWKKLVVVATLGVGALSLAQSAEELRNPAPGEWPTYGRNLEGWRYSPLNQINRSNVSRIKPVWSRGLGFRTDAQFSPVVYKGVMYVNGPDRITALNAVNGDLVWEYKVKLNPKAGFLSTGRSRGGVVVFDGKVYNALGDGRVVGVDAKTGKEVWSTQVGNVELGEGFSSGPIFADGKIVVGPSGADTGGLNGRVVALDAQNGKVAWTFNTIPQPGEAGFETWDPPTSAQYGGGSAWNTGVYDSVTKTVIYGVGQPIPWYAKGFRDGDNLYTASWVALDVTTGKLRWHFQVTPKDEWDADEIPTPTVTDLRINGKTQRVAILPTVTGFLVTVDVKTGKMVNNYQMMPEVTVHKGFTADGKSIIDDSYRYKTASESHLVCAFRWVDYEPAAYSPDTGLYYRPNRYDCANLVNKPPPADWKPGQSAINVELQSLPDRFSRYGALTAVNPVTGKVAWEFSYGYSNNAGPVVTAGGLVFSGFMDRVFRAFSAQTGQVLFSQVMPAYIQTDAITYAVNGKQYVAVAVGGSGALIALTKQTNVPNPVDGDVSIFVYALP